ncbi:hypothetical protein PsYK624_115050 [Phanerochaete sordida]|uniref:Uncharacterized protein n=1 Tax=Phanerochaete sordida TaxID=48140 RepID=A0A9P3LH99_9APHY|nr:hypothetical protein PsYK624_115050 [Phanerochaete sordida]
MIWIPASKREANQARFGSAPAPFSPAGRFAFSPAHTARRGRPLGSDEPTYAPAATTHEHGNTSARAKHTV